MCYSALTIASYFIKQAEGRKNSMQLNKMTYIAHGWCLAIYGKRLIVEDVEAWEYGPVIPALYYLFKKYGNDVVPYKPIQETDHIKPEDKALLNKIIEVYGDYQGLELSALTHQKDTPWDKTCREFGKGAIIPEGWIKEHYKEKLEKASDG